MNKCKFIFVIFFLWRSLLFLPLLFSELFLKYRPGYEYTNIFKFTIPQFPLNHFLVYPWANFDGIHYLSIANNGYSNNYGFFPFYPLLIKTASFLFGSTQPFSTIKFFSAFLISNISFLLLLITYCLLLNFDYAKSIINRSILFLMIFPTSFFFGSLYSESLFLLLVLLSFYFARKKNWFLAGLFSSLASLTRIVGIFLLPALLYEFYKSRHSGDERSEDSKTKRGFWTSSPCCEAGQNDVSFLFLSLPVISLFTYSYFTFKQTGNFLAFVHAQGNFANNRLVTGVVLIPQTIFRYIKILLSLNPYRYEWWISLLELTMFVLVSILLYLAWRKKVRTSYLIFSVLSFLLPVSTGTFTALPRYVLVLFPIYITLAIVKQKWLQKLYMIVSTILLFLLLIAFSKGYFVA